MQVEGVKFALKHGGRVLLADEMGLGKTIQVQLARYPAVQQRRFYHNLQVYTAVTCQLILGPRANLVCK